MEKAVEFLVGFLLLVAQDQQEELDRQAEEITNLRQCLAGKASQITQLERFRYLDPLTGVKSYRYLDVLDDIFAGALLAEFLVIAFDLDNFKLLNDVYGHQAGDEVLKMVSEVMTRVVHSYYGDVVRRGGDEFTIFIPYETGKVEVAFILSRIISGIDQEIIARSWSYPVSLSHGYFIRRKGEDLETSMNCADQGLIQIREGFESEVDGDSEPRLRGKRLASCYC